MNFSCYIFPINQLFQGCVWSAKFWAGIWDDRWWKTVGLWSVYTFTIAVYSTLWKLYKSENYSVLLYSALGNRVRAIDVNRTTNDKFRWIDVSKYQTRNRSENVKHNIQHTFVDFSSISMILGMMKRSLSFFQVLYFNLLLFSTKFRL